MAHMICLALMVIVSAWPYLIEKILMLDTIYQQLMNYIKRLSLREEDQDLNIGYILPSQTLSPLVQLRMLLEMEMDLR